MKKLLLLAGLLICLVTQTLTRAAHADTIKTFVLNDGTTYSPLRGSGSAYGSFTLNIDTGTVLSINFDYVGRTLGTDASMSVNAFGGLTELSTTYGNNGTYRTSVDVYLATTTLVGYSGGFICSVAHPCFVNSDVSYFSGPNYVFQSGNLSAAPEPPSFMYLLLSVFCLASVPYVRKRVGA